MSRYGGGGGGGSGGLAGIVKIFEGRIVSAAGVDIPSGTPTPLLWEEWDDPFDLYDPVEGSVGPLPGPGDYDSKLLINWEASAVGVSRGANEQYNPAANPPIPSGIIRKYHNWQAPGQPIPVPPAIPWNRYAQPTIKVSAADAAAGRFLRVHVRQDSGGLLAVQPAFGSLGLTNTISSWSIFKIG